MGWILRDHDGRFLAAKGVSIPERYTVEVAGAVCIREALNWLKGTGMGDVIIETDSQLVYFALRSDDFNSSFGFIIADVKEVASTIDGVDFYFAKRSANRAVHTVGREVVSMSGCGDGLMSLLPFLFTKMIFLDTAEGVASTFRPYWMEATWEYASVIASD
ncbi:PREDICTED: uncharacterized protein LOC109152784 [Ipomoea nil]|uniref:uncharacterized protein LOC109152784 n=1 Tax=Ipomoea nil TaxID=35883 RepID=UPI000900F279|nr:PREDICTED: uncharacterized protein LOC109152784 [Ipomoea nil]